VNGLVLMAASVLVFALALGVCWIAAFQALRWGAFALAKGRPPAARRRRALQAIIALAAGAAAAVLGFLGIAGLSYIAAR